LAPVSLHVSCEICVLPYPSTCPATSAGYPHLLRNLPPLRNLPKSPGPLRPPRDLRNLREPFPLCEICEICGICGKPFPFCEICEICEICGKPYTLCDIREICGKTLQRFPDYHPEWIFDVIGPAFQNLPGSRPPHFFKIGR